MPYRLLIVDPSATARARVKRAVRRTEFAAARVAEAADGAEAIDLLRESPADLVLVDPDQPGGAELVGRIAAEPDTRGVPVVLLLAVDPRRLADPGWPAAAAARARRLHARAFVALPVRPADLQRVLADLLEPTHV